MTQWSIKTVAALCTLTPSNAPPLGPIPLKSSPLRMTASDVPAAITNPLVPDTSTPAVPVSQLIVMALVMVNAPKPPGSRQLISPAAAVFEIAPAKVLQGAVRLQGLASSPTPETQVRVAWADAGAANNSTVVASAAKAANRRTIFMMSSGCPSRPSSGSLVRRYTNVAVAPRLLTWEGKKSPARTPR